MKSPPGEGVRFLLRHPPGMFTGQASKRDDGIWEEHPVFDADLPPDFLRAVNDNVEEKIRGVLRSFVFDALSDYLCRPRARRGRWPGWIEHVER